MTKKQGTHLVKIEHLLYHKHHFKAGIYAPIYTPNLHMTHVKHRLVDIKGPRFEKGPQSLIHIFSLPMKPETSES